MDRREPINLSYQRINHFMGSSYSNPDLYNLSKILNLGSGFVRHMIEIAKRNQFSNLSEHTDDNKKITSIESLRKSLCSEDDFNSPVERKLITLTEIPPFRNDIMTSLTDMFRSDISDIKQSGSFIYPPGGYMSWHTNYKRPGIRVYCVYNENEGSEFKYYFNDEIKVIKEKKGWNINIFRIENPPIKMWHSVSTDTFRLSIGFRINDKRDWDHTR